MSSSSSSARNILDIPDEILAKIMLHFNARERVAFGNSCERLNSLVFGDKELLRCLDFSKEAGLTSLTHIQQYFGNEDTCKHILTVNIQNLKCMSSGQMVSDLIGKAINVVTLNIHGTKFKNLKELCSFLGPLVHLKRLSVDWPKPAKDDVNAGVKILQKPLSRLTYLSVEVYVYSNVFCHTVQLCQELEELHMVLTTSRTYYMENTTSSLGLNTLRNLKIAKFRGRVWSTDVKDSILAMVPDPQKWTDFHFVEPYYEGYLEKNVEVCDELWKVKSNPPFERISYPTGSYNDNIGWPLIAEFLLQEVIKITHKDVPEKFCCLTNTLNVGCQPCLLKIDEAKQLLQDPGYQISYLHFNHSIDPDCDAHLVASAFPNLSELVVTRIGNRTVRESSPRRMRPLKRRLWKRHSTVPIEEDDPTNLDSSFKMLVENTPHLKGLTIWASSNNWEYDLERWDVDALHLISRWTNLRAIRLRDIPFTDGTFLIDIGKECEQLEEVILFRLGPKNSFYYASELLQMLKYCKNLRKFSICQRNIENMSEIFSTLSNNTKLRKVRLVTKTEVYNSVELISSVEQLLRRCQVLTKLVFMVRSAFNRVDEELRPALQRIVADLNRPNLQFHGPVPSWPSPVYNDTSTSFFPNPLDDQQFVFY